MRRLTFLHAGLFLILSATAHGGIVLNEWNAVSGSNNLKGGNSDSFFGQVAGNGGNWMEFVVVGTSSSDTVDLRGWRLEWTENEDIGGGVDAAGSIQFSNSAVWSNVRRGTLITIIESANAGGQNTSTDTSFNGVDDWHINVATQQEQALGAAALVTTTTNDGVAGDFSVGNSDWELTIRDSSNNIVFGPIGESATGWQGGGISGEEVGKLEFPGSGATLADWFAITPSSAGYNDGSSSTFGAANQWSGGSSTQDFSALRAVPEPNALVCLATCLGFTLTRRRRGLCKLS